MLKLTLFLSLLLAFHNQVSANDFGLPDVRQYLREEYEGGTQNWEIIQHSDGMIYVANNEGVLSFDGAVWSIQQLPKKTLVRSVAEGPDGLIFAGGQGEFGYFRPNNSGALQFHSLIDRIPESEQLFDDVWDIVLNEEELWFRAGTSVYRGDTSSISKVEGDYKFEYLSLTSGSLIASCVSTGLLEWDGSQFKPIVERSMLPSAVKGVVSAADGMLIATNKDGIFKLNQEGLSPWEVSVQQILEDARLYAIELLKDGNLAVATTSGGLVIMDPDGRALSVISRASGLQNNNILSLVEDRNGDLWLGHDNGIDLVEFSSPITYISPDGDLNGVAYSLAFQDQTGWFGTNFGLFQTDWDTYTDPFSKGKFKQVANTTGQVWKVRNLDGEILMGHHEGPFQVDNGSAKLLAPVEGVWDFVKWPGRDDLMVAGHYRGLALFKKVKAKWEFQRILDGLEESARIMAADPAGYLWVSHPYRGVWKCMLEGDSMLNTTFYGKAEGFPSNLGIHVWDLNDEIVFTAEYGVYQYNEAEDRFIAHTEWSGFFDPDKTVRKLHLAGDGNIWFVEGDDVGYLKVEETSLSKEIKRVDLPMLKDELVGGFELIESAPGSEVMLFGAQNGFIALDVALGEGDYSSPRLLMREIWLGDQHDSTLLTHRRQTAETFSIDRRPGVLGFRFSCDQYARHFQPEFRYRLRGFDDQWSSWSVRREKEYTGLRSGSYEFEVEMRTAYTKEAVADAFAFRIAPAWYASPVAQAIYGLGILAILFGVYTIPRIRFKKEVRLIETEKNITILQQERKLQQAEVESNEMIGQLRSEKLEAEIEFQNRELASATMHLVQKNSLILKIRDSLLKMEKSSELTEMKKSARTLTNMLNGADQLDEEWERFSMHFDKVHADFLTRLRDLHPNLTPKDQKLCAFLRMNLSTKEIAPLLNISVRGVEISRYRLRKKLNLDSEVNLVEFVLAI